MLAPIRRLKEAVERATGEALDLRTSERERTLEIRGKDCRAVLRTPAEPDDPLFSLPELPADPAVVDADALRWALEATVFATSADHPFGSVCFSLRGAELRLLATDRSRYAEAVVPVDRQGSDGLSKTEFIPALACRAMAEQLARCTGPVHVGRAGSHVAVFTHDLHYLCLPAEQGFASDDDLVPTHHTAKCKVDRRALETRLYFIQALCPSDATVIGLGVSPGTLTLDGENAQVGSGNAVLEASTAGPALHVRVNARHLRQAVSCQRGTSVQLALRRPPDPLLVTPSDGSHPLCVLLSLRDS